ncbi:MAG: hypothetical protein ACR2QM_07925 [Longimicrobiales bacterium]
MRRWPLAVFSWAVPLLAACSGGEPVPEVDPELVGATSVHVVSLSGWGSQERPVPDTVRAEVGAAVIFQVADWWVHTVEFVAEEMSPAQTGFIETHARMLSPPLVERGSRFVVSFAGAPPGTYPFRVDGFGDRATGAVVVTDPVP